MNYLLHILAIMGIYCILALSLNLVVGYGGLISLSQAAFFGIGAYAYALLLKGGIPWMLSLILTLLFSAFFSWCMSYPLLRFRGDHFILGTIGIQLIVFDILYNWVSLTRGPYGISEIPRFTIGGYTIRSIPQNFGIILIFLTLIWWFVYRVAHSPYGRILKSVREDETASQALGKHTRRVKIWAFVISGSIAAIAGALYAGYITYIDPTSFTLDESIFILTAVLIGGSGNIRGPLVGAAVVVAVPEILRFVGLPNTIAPNVRQILYGVIILILMFWRPKGIAGEYSLE